MNDRVVKSRSEVKELLPSIRDKIYSVTLATGQSGEDIILDNEQSVAVDGRTKTKLYTTTIGKIANINYAIVNKALGENSGYKFNTLKVDFQI